MNKRTDLNGDDYDTAPNIATETTTSESAVNNPLCFDTGDVISVAKALIDLGVEFEDCSDYDDEGYMCHCCDAEKQRDIESSFDFKHELACPILKAQDLLTGA